MSAPAYNWATAIVALHKAAERLLETRDRAYEAGLLAELAPHLQGEAERAGVTIPTADDVNAAVHESTMASAELIGVACELGARLNGGEDPPRTAFFPELN